MSKNFYTQFDHADPVIDFTGSESLARQEFANDADINNIIKRYQATGSLVDPSVARTRRPMFGDFASVPDFQAAQDLLIRAHDQFDSLPVEIRSRFNYDPAALLAFVNDPRNRDEAIRLGIVEIPAEPASASQTRVEAASPTPPASSSVTE